MDFINFPRIHGFHKFPENTWISEYINSINCLSFMRIQMFIEFSKFPGECLTVNSFWRMSEFPENV